MEQTRFQRPLRILHLMSTWRWTGVAEPALSVALWHQKWGHKTWVAGIWGRSFEEQAQARGANLAREIPLSRDYNPFRQWALIGAIVKFCADHQIDIIHAHLPHDHWLAVLALLKIKTKSVRMVRTFHRYEKPRMDPAHRWLYERKTDALITVSRAQGEMLQECFPRAKARIHVVHGGVDPEVFRYDDAGRREVRADMGERLDARVAGLVAHLGYNRGIQWLLAAAPSVVEAVPNATIWIVGDGEMRQFLRKELRKPCYRRRVLLAGYRSNDLPQVYSALDVGLLLGLGSEGTARAALETMATGRPVIAVRKGALIDTITHGEDGLLIEENDVPALQKALIDLLSNPLLAQKMGEKAREKIISSFTEEVRARRTLDLYFSLLQQGGLSEQA